uniref:GST N-terminal domain-containing protein n=1 Tax=Ditylum brightwellii TaxID=49249 RepID=A0A7S1ZVR8_9STRA|mmetsp:Transcript_39500/g.59360  ORF Transcript_39500/g.59360 Transcript_39500/m.59360 type:complete len:303 (+) Transcript_39500:42-950(+)
MTTTRHITRRLLSTSTSETSSSLPSFRYLSAWFCPYAHRATLALEHHSTRISYEWVEALGWEQRQDANNVTGTGKEWWYHWKADELKRANPSALVPTLIPLNASTKEPMGEKAVYESLVTIDYIDAVSGASGVDRLVPEDPYLSAKCRIWADKVNKECCSPYYGVLVRKEEGERMEHFEKLITGLKAFSKEVSQSSGPTFLDDGQLSSVDLALLPWAFRFYVFEHYRGPDYVISTEDPELEPYHEWLEHVLSLDSVKRTLPDKDDYLEHIGKYADSSARSKVANAVRRGVAAHDLDDEKDEY